jgi:hypothetical protein
MCMPHTFVGQTNEENFCKEYYSVCATDFAFLCQLTPVGAEAASLPRIVYRIQAGKPSLSSSIQTHGHVGPCTNHGQVGTASLGRAAY